MVEKTQTHVRRRKFHFHGKDDAKNRYVLLTELMCDVDLI